MPDRFETRRGIVRVQSDALVFDESVEQLVRDTYRRYWCADEAWRKAVFVGYVSALVYGTVWFLGAVAAGELLLPGLVVVGVGTLVLVDRMRGFNGRDRIPLAAIEDISCTRGQFGITRPRIVVRYIDAGSPRRRRINLPSLATKGGEEVFERAVAAFEQRGFSPRATD